MKTKGKAWQLVVTVLLIAAFVYTAFFGVAVKYGDVTKTYIKGAQDIRFGVDIKGGVNVTFAPSDNYDATDDQLDAAQLVCSPVATFSPVCRVRPLFSSAVEAVF